MTSKNERTPFTGPGPDAQYREYLKQGKFMLQFFAGCDSWVLYPRVLCPCCGGIDYTWREASGSGTVYSTSVIRRKPESGGDYNIALIDLEEGPRIMSRVVGIDAHEVRIGLKVRARIVVEDDASLVEFEGAQ